MAQSYVFCVLWEECYLIDQNVGEDDRGEQEAVWNMKDNNLKVMAASDHVSTDKTNSTDIHVRNYSLF
jgi:hypothetical protein